MVWRNFVQPKTILTAFIGGLAVGFLYTILQKGRVSAGNRIPRASSFLNDERVYDCITKELRGAGSPGRVKTTPFKILERQESVEEERSKSQQEFVKIYNQKVWGRDSTNPLSGSGSGSTLHSTIEAISGLHSVINELKTKLGKDRISMLDVPCGDMGWMRRFLETREDVDYTGMDIVPELISIHKSNYSRKPWTFIHRDVVKDGFMGAKYDLIFSRQMLQHLVNRDVMTFLHEISKSGSKYLLVTSFPSTASNLELNLEVRGRFHFLNLEAPPIMLAPPLCYYRDGPNENQNQKHALMLYTLPLRQVVNCKAARAMKIRKSTTKLDTYFACGNWSI